MQLKSTSKKLRRDYYNRNRDFSILLLLNSPLLNSSRFSTSRNPINTAVDSYGGCKSMVRIAASVRLGDESRAMNKRRKPSVHATSSNCLHSRILTSFADYIWAQNLVFMIASSLCVFRCVFSACAFSLCFLALCGTSCLRLDHV